jgi:XFP C-terminal domain
LIHRLSYCRTNHHNIHVRGYKEEGTITTPFDMTVLNDLDRFHLVMDTIDRVPQIGERGIYLKKQLRDKLIEHKRYIDLQGEDLPEIRKLDVGRETGGPESDCRSAAEPETWVRLGAVDLFFSSLPRQGKKKRLGTGFVRAKMAVR